MARYNMILNLIDKSLLDKSSDRKKEVLRSVFTVYALNKTRIVFKSKGNASE